MEWDSSMETGDPTVDAQHRTLFETLGQLGALDATEERGAIPATLDALAEYVAVHFTMEEDLMARAGLDDADIAAHLAEHRELTRRTREMVLLYRTGELDSIAHVAALLTEWLAHHIAGTDRVLVDHMRAAGS